MGFKTEFKFDLKQMVAIRISGEIGEVKAQGKWATGNTAYQLLYKAADGTAQDRWFEEDDLVAVGDTPTYGVTE